MTPNIASCYFPVNSILRIAELGAFSYASAMDAKEIRVANLKRWIDEFGGGSQRVFAEKFGMNVAHLSQLVNRHRDIGDKLARKIEAKLKFDHGTMDHVSPADQDELREQLLNIWDSLSDEGKDSLLGNVNRIYSKERPKLAEENPNKAKTPHQNRKAKVAA